MDKLRRLLWSLGLSALVGLMAGQAGAASISMTISVTGAAVGLNIINSSASPATEFTVSAAELGVMNAYLSANASQYRFATLGGTSNFPGIAGAPPIGQAILTVTGEVDSVTAGNAGLQLIVTESGFTAPTGPNGTLDASGGATFTNQPTFGGHDFTTSFTDASGTTSIGPISLISSQPPNPNSDSHDVTTPIPSVSAPFTLTHVLDFHLSAGSATALIKDQFTNSGVINAGVVPEPASLVMFMTGMPLPLVTVALFRRCRRNAAKRG